MRYYLRVSAGYGFGLIHLILILFYCAIMVNLKQFTHLSPLSFERPPTDRSGCIEKEPRSNCVRLTDLTCSS